MTKSLNLLNAIETGNVTATRTMVMVNGEWVEVTKRAPGRPVNPDSVRQQRLAEQAARAEANGGTPRRGRPIVEGCARQLKLAARAAALAAGAEIKRGRPKVNLVDVMDSLAEVNLEPVVEVVEPVVEAVEAAAPAPKKSKK